MKQNKEPEKISPTPCCTSLIDRKNAEHRSRISGNPPRSQNFWRPSQYETRTTCHHTTTRLDYRRKNENTAH